MLGRFPRGIDLVIDCIGAGRPIFDMFTYSGIVPMGVLITGGAACGGALTIKVADIANVVIAPVVNKKRP